jgi:pilus assembly protein CpaB
LIAAVALAVIGLAIFGFIATQSHQVNAPPPVAALIATKDIPAKTRLTDAMFAVAQKPADQVDPSAFTSASQVVGQVATVPISKDAIVTHNEVASVASLGLAVQLRPGMRAIAIPVDAVKDVSNLVQPGDHVDVIATPPKVGASAPAFTILRDVVVLSSGVNIDTTPTVPAPGASATPANAQTLDVRTVTLEVTPEQADQLISADINATLRLALRSPEEPMSSQPAEHLVYPTQTAAPSAAVKSGPSVPKGVPVINGDTVSFGDK